MKFIINTAIDPHFCALFDEKGVLVEKQEWTERKRDGREVFDFLEKHKMGKKKLSFIGGVSGPGGFSSLRAGAGILNALSFSCQLPIHAVRADEWIREFLGSDDFLLNSFSEGVFFLQGKKLERVDVTEAAKKFAKKKLWVELLPEEKKSKFPSRLEKPFVHSEMSLLKVLESSPEKKEFMPEYEFPAV